MPSLFNRRSRSVSTTRPPAQPSSSAHLAAAQAFLANRQPSANLSSAAAAAALRSMSPPPTPVNQVQTKRMLSRQSSVSSVGSAARGRSKGGLQRNPSSSSMTERTFRSPSPGQPAPTDGPSRSKAPPVPRVPEKFVTEDVPPIPKKSHRRSMSLEATVPRALSPPPNRSSGSGQHTSRAADPVFNAATVAARRSASLQQGAELQRTNSNNSINFSYPRGVRPNSPPPQSPVENFEQQRSQRSAASHITATETAKIQNSLNKTASKPVKKKKNYDRANGEGSHLQEGSTASQSRLTKANAIAATSAPRTEEQPANKSRERAALTGEISHFPTHDDLGTSEVASPSSTPSRDAERRAQRAAGKLQKQPSIVREDWEGEQEDVESLSSSPTSPTFGSRHAAAPSSVIQSRKPMAEANVSRKIDESTKPTVNAAVTTPKPKLVEAVKSANRTTRQSSISPSRSFRFSDRLASDMTAGRKHEPLPRSVSPAKSALKHSSPAGHDTLQSNNGNTQRRGSSVAPSETSDISTDGLPTRRTSARVAFETDPTVTETVDFESSPHAQRDVTRKGLFGLKSKGQSSSNNAFESEEKGMGPRPALPSFGSVRKGKSTDTTASLTATSLNGSAVSSPKSPTSSSGSATAESSRLHTSMSSDHAVGGILQRESVKNNSPLAPEVTSVEGTGYASDTDSLSSDDEGSHLPTTSTRSPPLRASDHHDEPVNEDVPHIAVQPATPGMDDAALHKEWFGDIPGEYPAASDPSSAPTRNEKPHVDVSTDRGMEAAGPDVISVDDQDRSAPQSPAANPLNTIVEEDTTDNDSIYSDAAEDLSDLDGDGFGSINAIVESPMVKSSPAGRFNDQSESPVVAVKERRSDPVRTESWDDTQARWSELAKQSKNNLDLTAERPKETLQASKWAPTSAEQALSKAEEGKVKTQSVAPSLEPPAHIASKPKKKKKPQQASDTQTSLVDQPRSESTTNAGPASTTLATKRLSAATNKDVLRHSMRAGPDSTMATTMRQRPQSMIVTPTHQRGALQKKHVPSASASKPRQPQRTLSNDSDSGSSFRKERRNRKANQGPYSMKRSMRGAATEERGPAARDARRDVRSLSPVNRRPTSPFGGRSIRMSMRGSQDQGAPSLRPQMDQKRSSSFLGKALSTKSPSRPASSLGAKLKSRFADSDDEDGPRPSTYRSRFADSSDEEEPEPMRPVRGIPKRRDEVDSTDLDDSSDDQKKTKPVSKKPAPKKLELQVPEVSSPVPSEPLSPATAKKKGFWGRMRGKKEKTKGPNANLTILNRERNDSSMDNGRVNEAVDTDDAANMGFASNAERDALVEETMRKLEAASGTPTSPARGKLARRVTPQRVLSDSWPLPPKIPAASNNRPITSDGVNGLTRPGIGERQPTSDTVVTAGGTVVYGRGGKKKKFPRLRKAFGLVD